ncbi:RES family NAD+ phosphorylase [Geoalkalibacter halelectricus]|uniref:RES family NAD+ phosphorylase n=1 Tax=Geoalkalibacter halelectricus TaxID=2847045 RepID=A0ABY5ZIX9_9BACT|nr:RES family NAD+ phosphorylase [Geoalkalibacter halelectricus]MDO3376854.1 RES family NAD+ phosphorylase [Geoalkalibacter halelectricus]UWZ79081.1 RES family NAD+ phosphorylase [Geoalkalibacter halelectricus]
MHLYRLVPTRYAADLTGEGARLFGGRWSPPGIALIHTAQTVSLATLEYLVHQKSLAQGPCHVSLVIYELPEGVATERMDISSLPEGWDRYPSPTSLWDFGKRWVMENRSVALLVPSAVVPMSPERNVLLNPLHPDFRLLRQVEILPYRFDERLKS